tara:strand:+ start:4110 stop:5102 length:993 start_codon:yes stop_codon:yes gene_type:complete
MKAEIKNKKILVTGGAGFIGSNLCEKLIKLNNKVICLDNFSTGNRKNLSNVLKNKNFILIEGDIRDFNICLVASKNVNFILHQAALGSVPRSINDPLTTNDVNISGFLNILLAAKENNVKRVVYAASSSTYGDSDSLPKVEDKIGKPLSPYAITKYVNELYAKNFSEIYSVDTIGLRYFNVFGEKQDPNGAYAAVIPKFISLLINHKSPVINGDGTNSRDFTYIENVIQANILSMLITNKKSLNNVYNIACGERNSLNDLFNYLVNYLSNYDNNISEIKPIYGPPRFGDVLHSHASIEKAKLLLNYNPRINLNDGLKKSIKWYWNALKLN